MPGPSNLLVDASIVYARLTKNVKPAIVTQGVEHDGNIP